VDINTTYYVLDYNANRIFLLNDNYGYLTHKAFTNPAYMVTVYSYLYITGNSDICKTDKYLNVLKTHTEFGASYRGIYFNSTENSIYVAPNTYTYFQVFDLNLTLKYTVSISTYRPYSFSEYNNELYVGTTLGLILVINNKIVKLSFTVCSGSTITSTVSDNFGLMAISCENYNLVKFYYHNGIFTGKNLTTPQNSMFVGFDSKGHFVQISKFQISVYN
jgi:hypothetical protein